MTIRKVVKLPQATSRTTVGPKLQLSSSTLRLSYGCEQDDGALRWTHIIFHDVLKFEYRQEAVCGAEALDGYNQMAEYQESDWLRTTRARLTSFLGSQAPEGQELLYVHWRIYFDDAGCVDVVAESFEIEQS